MEPLTEKKVELGKRYKFPQLSTKDVEVLETIENWIEFHEDEFVWYCEYRGLWKDDEDPDTKAIGDIEKTHCWRYTSERANISAVEFVYQNDSEFWVVKVRAKDHDTTVILAFSSKEKAERMYRYFCQYKGFKNY